MLARSITVRERRIKYSVCFFTLILIGLKRFATLLPNYWLAETPQALALIRLGRQSAERDFKAKLIGTEGTRLLREKRVQGRPHRRKDAEEATGRTARGKRVPGVEIQRLQKKA
ncbi:hypothetical protein ACFQ9Y_15835 [Peribacillus simplex]|uniref:hypothetical protein n=1 Tax=Peribacillus simplex TaxID=1478 RepID=UPI00366E4338